MKTENFWLDGLPPYQESPALSGCVRADVAIVGAGFAGISTAYHLKKAAPGLRVIVLEGEFVGFGASGRNAGFAMTLFGLNLEITALRFGRQNALAARRFMEKAVSRVSELVAEHSIAADLVKGGLLAVATNKTQAARLQNELDLCGKLGIEGVRWLSALETRREVNSATFLGAKFDPCCALINPAKFARGFKSAAESLGVEFHERSPVLNIRSGKEITLELAHGKVTASKIVLATNAYSQRFALLRRKALPVHTYIALTRPLKAHELAAIGWKNRQRIEHNRNLVHYYRLTADNRLLMGGGAALYHYGGGLGQDQNAATLDRLKTHIARTFPALSDIEITHHWGGPISGTLDLAPALGASRDGRILYALGCIGHGVALMTLAGQVLGDLALERKSEWTELFFVNRWTPPVPAEPLRTAVARTIIKALELQDRWDERLSRH